MTASRHERCRGFGAAAIDAARAEAKQIREVRGPLRQPGRAMRGPKPKADRRIVCGESDIAIPLAADESRLTACIGNPPRSRRLRPLADCFGGRINGLGGPAASLALGLGERDARTLSVAGAQPHALGQCGARRSI